MIEALKNLYFSKNSPKIGPLFTFGMELEFPIVSLNGSAPDPSFAKKILTVLSEQNGWEPVLVDRSGNFIKATDHEGAIISYEACYGILELSLTPQKTVQAMEKQICTLFYLVQNFLLKNGLQLIPTGLNPFPWSQELTPLETPYIQMIYGISQKFAPKKSTKIAHFHFVICSSQLHLDVNYDNAVEILNFFNGITWVKALLFANSFDVHRSSKQCLCMRDVYYRENTLWYSSSNVGPDHRPFHSIEDFLANQTNKSIFYVSRSGKYIFFRPLPLKKFIEKNHISGFSVLADGTLESQSIQPECTDVSYFRPYNHATLTKRGTIEIRSECQQPLPSVMASAAFHLGLLFNLEKAREFIAQYEDEISDFNRLRNDAIYLGYDIQNTMKMNVSDFVFQLLLLAREGLSLRGLLEEDYLTPLFSRLERRTNPAMELKAALENGTDLTTYFNQKTQEPLGIQGYYATNNHRN